MHVCGCGQNVQSRCVLLFPSDLTPDPSAWASQARLRWQTLNTDPPLGFLFSCLAGDSPGNTTQAPGPSLAPGPEQLPTPAGSKTASVPGASRGPQDPPQRLNLTEAVRVLCEIEKVAIAIQRRFLQQESIPETSLYLGHPSCNVSDHNSTHVLLVAGWTECGTVVQSVRAGGPGSGAHRVGGSALSIRNTRWGGGGATAVPGDQGRLCTPGSLTLSGGPKKGGQDRASSHQGTDCALESGGSFELCPVGFWCKGPGVSLGFKEYLQ